MAQVLDYYNRNFTKYYSLAVVESEIFPVEVLNEVRAAFTHLAKAHAQGPGSEPYFEENRNALRHVKRASLDCLKLAILAVSERMEKKLDIFLDQMMLLPAKVHQQSRDLQNRRKGLLNSEGSHPSTKTVDELHDLYVAYANFEIEIDEDYSGLAAEKARLHQEKIKKEHEERERILLENQEKRSKSERLFNLYIAVTTSIFGAIVGLILGKLF